MRTSRHVLIVVVSLVVLAGIVLGLFLSWRSDWLFHWREFGTGNQIVSRVNVFRMSHNRLPETLNELGVDDRDLKIFYRKVSNDEYCVWFGTTLGDSEIYNSRTKRWEINTGCDTAP